MVEEITKFCYVCTVNYYTAMKTDVHSLEKIPSEENLIQNGHLIVQVSQTDNAILSFNKANVH